MTKRYPLHHEDARPMYVTVPLEEYEKLKKRIADLEKENESLKYSVATLDTDLAMAKRWRKFSEEKPNENDYYLVTNGDFVDFDYGCYSEQDEEWQWEHNGKWEYYMPLPEPPEVR